MSTGSGRLEGRVIIVTGGGSGIGRASALRLAQEGAAVAVADLREPLAQEIAVDYGPQNIRAVCICPGAVETNLGAFSREDRRESAARLPRSPMTTPVNNRRADPSEIASVAAFLFSDDASFITGSAIFADGGLTAI